MKDIPDRCDAVVVSGISYMCALQWVLTYDCCLSVNMIISTANREHRITSPLRDTWLPFCQSPSEITCSFTGQLEGD